MAPVKSGDEDALVKSFVRVEAIPRFALEKGVPWGWHSYREYLDGLNGRLGINMGGLVGHIAVRQYVMGEESVERQATKPEVQRMQQLVREGMEAGAFGFSTNRNERHMREDGKPVPSRMADVEELFGLCEPLGELNAGVIQSTLGQYTTKHFDLYGEWARRTGRPHGCPSIQSARTVERTARSYGRGVSEGIPHLPSVPHGAAGQTFRSQDHPAF